jgi:hypothetical protein
MVHLYCLIVMPSIAAPVGGSVSRRGQSGMMKPMGDDNRVSSRGDDLLPEEETAGTADAHAQAEAILSESDERSENRSAAPDTYLEGRSSDQATPPA